MSIEEQLERGVVALESIATSLGSIAARTPELHVVEQAPKPKRTRKKKEAAPAPQPEVVATDEPAQSSLIQEAPAAEVEPDPAPSPVPAPATTAVAEEDMSPEELDKELMSLAVGAAPAVIQQIFATLATVGAKNTRQVPEGSRRTILAKATQAVQEMSNG